MTKTMRLFGSSGARQVAAIIALDDDNEREEILFELPKKLKLCYEGT